MGDRGLNRPAAASETTPPPRARRWPLVVAALGWCGLIAATSSTVILPQQLFGWLAAHLFGKGERLRRFVTFWGFGWFFIVKGWHAAEFAILFLLTRAALDRLLRQSRRRHIVMAAALCLLFAVSDEYHQTFVPGRGGTWRDVAIDGIGIGVTAWVALARRRPGSTGPAEPGSCGRARSLTPIAMLRMIAGTPVSPPNGVVG